MISLYSFRFVLSSLPALPRRVEQFMQQYFCSEHQEHLLLRAILQMRDVLLHMDPHFTRVAAFRVDGGEVLFPPESLQDDLSLLAQPLEQAPRDPALVWMRLLHDAQNPLYSIELSAASDAGRIDVFVGIRAETTEPKTGAGIRPSITVASKVSAVFTRHFGVEPQPVLDLPPIHVPFSLTLLSA